MPSELPRTPHETYQSLLNGPHANGHMPIVGYEVAYLGVPSRPRFARRPWVTWRGVLVFISGAIFVVVLMGTVR